MSAPITINAAQTQLTSPSSSPGLYVPIHKRAGSNTSSRPSSPSDTPAPQPSTYSAAALLALRPFADESMKGKMLVTCPEVVLTRKMRKGLEFNGRRTELSVAAQQLPIQPSAVSETDATATIANPIPVQAAPIRVLPRRSRPTGRAPERRRNLFLSPGQPGSKFASRRGDDSWRLHAMSTSPVLIV